MSVILAIVPAIVIGIPIGIVNGIAKAAGIQLIDEKKAEADNARRMAELLQKEKLTLLQKKELDLLRLGRVRPQLQAAEVSSGDSLVIPTRIRNIEFLLRTLQSMGTEKISVRETEVTADFNNLSICYQPDCEGYIHLHFRGNIQEEEAYQFTELVERQYGKLLQQAVYSRIKEQAVTQGLELEKEEIEENNTIVLTYNVQ